MYAKVIPKQLGILAEEFGEWGGSFPKFIPEEFEKLADDVEHFTTANPNELGRRIDRLNASE